MKAAPWLIALAAVACAAGVAWWAQQRAGEATERARVAEAEALTAEGYAVAAQVEAEVAEADARRLFAESRTLLARIEKLERSGARIVYVERTQTDVVTVDGPPGATCLVASGDKMQLRVSEVGLQTDAGNAVLVGQAEAWKIDPDLLLVKGELRGVYTVVPPPPDKRWPWWVHEAIGLGAGLVGGLYLGSRR